MQAPEKIFAPAANGNPPASQPRSRLKLFAWNEWNLTTALECVAQP